MLPLIGAALLAAALNPVTLVDPFVGTSGTVIGGPVDDYPGADAPFGMVQWSPDTPSSPPSGAYDYKDTALTGFSLTHISGAGCNIFTDFRVTPTVGTVQDPANVKLAFSHAGETATPGYYAVTAGSPAIKTELAVTPRTGAGAFTFPAVPQANLLINVSSDQAGANDSSFTVSGPREISGSVTSGSFCGLPNTFTAYVVMRFDRPFASYGTWHGTTVEPNTSSVRGPNAGGYVTFDTRTNATVHAQVSVSWVSVDGARANLQAEAKTWDVGAVRDATAAAWQRLLSEVSVEGGTPAEQRTFYTALYHSLLFPSLFSDADGSYRGFDNRVHHVAPGHAEYANFSGWDIYRTQIPLIALLAPHETSDMMRSMVDASAQMGWLPKWPVANGESGVMGGDSADPILAGAYAYGARDFNARAALRAMVKGASDTAGVPGQGWYVERQGLDEYLHYGYVTNAHTTDVSPVPNGASVTLEYSVDDFAIAEFARAVGDTATYNTYLRRSQNWTHLYDNSNGLIAPRDGDGAFMDTPITESGQSGFQEGNSWQYTWMVPQNLGGLVYAMGGRDAARSRLDWFFSQLNAGPAQPFAWYGNEPGFAAAWTYLYAGAPYREEAVARQVMSTLYLDAPDGIPGNDDLGAMSSWYAWNAMGLYPIDPPVPLLLVGTPLFTHVTLHSPGGTTLDIDAPNAGDGAPYVRGLRIDGIATNKAWLRLPLGGATALSFDVGSDPNTQFGAAIADAPPSFGIGPLAFPPSTLASLTAPPAFLDAQTTNAGTLAFTVSNPDSKPARVRLSASTTPGVTASLETTSITVPAASSATVNVGVKTTQRGLFDVFLRGNAANGAVLSHATGVVRVAGNAALPLGFVANFSGNTVMPIDPRTHAYGVPIPVGKSPGGIALSPDNARAYVANQASNDVSVIDTQKLQVVATVKTGGVPAGIQLAPTGNSSGLQTMPTVPRKRSIHRRSLRRRPSKSGVIPKASRFRRTAARFTSSIKMTTP